MGRNGRTDLPRGLTKRLPPLSWTVFLLGCSLTGNNWAAPLLIDQTPFQRLLILALLLISGNVHPNPGPIRNNPCPGYPCSICHLDVGRDSLQCTTCHKWVHFRCSSLTRADFAQSVQLALQWVGVARRAAPKVKLAPLLRPIPSLRRLRPLPQGSLHFHLAFINRVPLRAPHVTPFVCALMR